MDNNCCFNCLTVCSQNNAVQDCARLHEEVQRWEQIITQDENRQTQAEVTQKFWQECPAKISVSCQDLLHSCRGFHISINFHFFIIYWCDNYC